MTFDFGLMLPVLMRSVCLLYINDANTKPWYYVMIYVGPKALSLVESSVYYHIFDPYAFCDKRVGSGKK